LGKSGRYHTGHYGGWDSLDGYPYWVQGGSITFTGTLLPDNLVQGTTSHKFYDWGYVDNRPNAEIRDFKISDAIQVDGSAIHLDYIDFVKVQTSAKAWVNETVGEVSTETGVPLDKSFIQ
jgi:hypothetical protein